MSDLRIQMPPLSMAAIEATAYSFLHTFAPHMATSPQPLQLREIVERRLSGHGIHVYPASAMEMGDMIGATVWDNPRHIDVLIREDEWDHFFTDGPYERRPRATVAHELGHAVLHVTQMRRYEQLYKARPDRAPALPRMSSSLPENMDAEWQAWAFATCILAPRAAILACGTRDPRVLADGFKVSESLMKHHLKRLCMPPQGER